MGSIIKLEILLFFFLAFAILAPTLEGGGGGGGSDGIGEFDEYWQKRAEAAQATSFNSYQQNPMDINEDLNRQVHEALEGQNDTRRNLRRRSKDSCEATNPIDRCWRCDPKWAKNRKKLASCALGFGRNAMGGKNGRFYKVTDPSDNDMVNPKPGTLRHAVIQERPLWIVFARDMNIRLNQELMLTSNKTIDGRGANVHIANGAQITIQFVSNVIIHGIHIHDSKVGNGGMIRDSVSHYGIRTRSDGDGISLFGASNVWIDHVSLSNSDDGLIDAIMGSTAITISNCFFTNQDHVMLFGASDSYSGDTVLQVTVAFNHFGRGLVQRMPRVRWGFVHVLNNDYTQWEMYAIGGSQHPTIISEGNRFVAPDDINCKEVTKRDYAYESEWKNWNWRSQGDLFVNGAFFVHSGNPIKRMGSKDMINSKPGSFASRLTRYAGVLACSKGKPC